MKKYIRCIIVIGLIAIILIENPLNIAAQIGDTKQILVLYDTVGVESEFEGNIKLVVDMLTMFGNSSNIQRINDYKSGMLVAYDRIVIIRNADYQLEQTSLVTDLNNSNKNIFYIGKGIKETFPKVPINTIQKQNLMITVETEEFKSPQFLAHEIECITEKSLTSIGKIKDNFGGEYPFAVVKENIIYLPYLKDNSINKISLGEVMKIAFNKHEYGKNYLVIKNIYPFSKLNKLTEMSKLCFEHGIPIICSIMPIFENIEYPAIQRYAQILRYVESNQGTIIIQSPNVRETEAEKELLGSKMEKFIDYIVSYGVIPLGIGVNREWLTNNYYKDNLFSFFSTNVLLPRHSDIINKSSSTYNFKENIYGIKYEEFIGIVPKNKKSFLKIPMNLGITVDLDSPNTIAAEVIKTIEDRWVPIDNYRFMDHTVKTNTTNIEAVNGIVTVNNSVKDFYYNEMPLEIEFKETKEKNINLEKSFIIGNKILLSIITMSLIVFIGLILVGIKIHRNKFIK
ncbi:MAG: hypothetical protein AB9856_13310 [Cellulosilyticaceae bacterium]